MSEGFIEGAVIASIAALVFIVILWMGKDDYWKQEAVKHNAAQYVLIPATGAVRWEWKQ